MVLRRTYKLSTRIKGKPKDESPSRPQSVTARTSSSGRGPRRGRRDSKEGQGQPRVVERVVTRLITQEEVAGATS